ncbi:MAG: DUF4170 domain-containing protein [Alphaproteobacteria bacterium]|jgi:hypothetical protein
MTDVTEQMPKSVDDDAPTLFVVYGGRVDDPTAERFVDLSTLDIRGIFDSYEAAFSAWRGASQQHVDNAFIKYVIKRLG